MTTFPFPSHLRCLRYYLYDHLNQTTGLNLKMLSLKNTSCLNSATYDWDTGDIEYGLKLVNKQHHRVAVMDFLTALLNCFTKRPFRECETKN